MAMRGVLRISLEEVEIPVPITQNFERHLLLKQSQGKELLSFLHIGGGRFRIYYGEAGEGHMDTQQLKDIAVAPWRLYVFTNVTKLQVGQGNLFCSLRLVDEFSEVMEIGDPVEMVDISSLEVLGSAEVVGLHRFRLDALTPEIIQTICNRVKSVAEVKRLLECKYEQPVHDDEVVTAIVMRASSPVNLDTSTFDEDWGLE